MRPIREALRGKRLLVTGATGFLGKAYLAKLLALAPGVERVTCLARPGKGKDAAGRLEHELLRSPALARTPDAARRRVLAAIEGDASRVRFGLDDAAWQALARETDVVVHIAGVVDFSPPLGDALAVNVYGTRAAIELAKAAGAPLVHTSTCFVSGCRDGLVPDDVALGDYPLREELGHDSFDAEEEVRLCEAMLEAAAREARDPAAIARHAQGGKLTVEDARHDAERHARQRLRRLAKERAQSWGFPNTYTYTKGIAEQLVLAAKHKGLIQASIARPAILESAIRFPEPGWVQGANTTAPLVYLIYRGQRFFPLRADSHLDILPIDMCAGGMVAITAALAEGEADTCYQLGSADTNLLPNRRSIELCALAYRDRAAPNQPTLLGLLQHRHFEAREVSAATFDRVSLPLLSRLTHRAKSLLERYVPTAAPRTKPDPRDELDSLARAAKKLHRGLDRADRGLKKMVSLFEEYLPFTHGPRPIYQTGNLRALRARLDPEERALVDFEPEAIDWRHYWLTVHLPGLERHVFAELDALAGGPQQGGARARQDAATPGNGTGTHADGAVNAHAHLRAIEPPPAGPRDVVTLFRERIEAWPDLPLFEDLRGREVASRVAACAARLRALGVGPGDRVALCGENSLAWCVTFLATLTLGATAAPLDQALGARDVRALVRAARAKVLCTSAKRRAALGNDDLGAPQLSLEEAAQPTAPGATPPSLPAVAIDPESTATLIFTSGTTGAYKGVKLPHRALAAQVAALGQLFVLTPEDRIVSVLPSSHAFELTCGFLLPLSRGAHICFAGDTQPQAIRAAFKRVRPTALIAVPALLEAFLRAIRAEVSRHGALALGAFERAIAWHTGLRTSTGQNFGKKVFAKAHEAFGGELRFLVSGGATLPNRTFDALRGLGLDIYEGYGLSEAGPVVACARPGRTPKAGSVGEPIPGVEVRIHEPGSDGIGELWMRGPGVMTGYDGDLEATSAVLDAEGWLKTGDLVQVDRRGQIAIVGRSKDAIVDASGNTVYPDEIEELYAAVEDVLELAVARVRTDEAREVPGALVRLEDGADRALCLERFREIDQTLPFPKRLKVVRFTDRALPRTQTRKAKRAEVAAILEDRLQAERALERAPAELDARASMPGLEAARTLLAEVAGVPAARVTADADLHEDLGVDSLQLAELAERVGQRAGHAPELTELRKVHDLARRLSPGSASAATVSAGASAGEASSARGRRNEGSSANGSTAFALPDPVKRAGNALLTFLQKRAYESGLEVEVAGRDNIPWHAPSIVVANHCSHLDVGLIKHALGDYARHAGSVGARDYFFGSPITRVYFESFTEVLPVERDARSRDGLGHVVERLSGGHTVILFPEGTRSTTGLMGPFRAGLGYLVTKTRMGVLPVYLRGTHRALPKGSIVPRRRDMGAVVGRYLSYEELTRPVEGLSRHHAYRAIAERVRNEVAALARSIGEEIAPAALAPVDRPHGADADGLDTESGTFEAPTPVSLLDGLLAGLPARFKPGAVERSVSIYVKVGEGDDERWTLKISPSAFEVVPGKAEGRADCVVRAAPDVLARLLSDGELPGMEDILSGRFKTNDPDALRALVDALGLGEPAAAPQGVGAAVGAASAAALPEA